MVCGSCSATIAEKAIVCYRCGTATAIPATVNKPMVVRTRRPWVIVASLVVMALLAAWFAVGAPAESLQRFWGALAGVVMVVAAVYLALRRPG